jgi:predicted amidohydrolase YtcJ
MTNGQNPNIGNTDSGFERGLESLLAPDLILYNAKVVTVDDKSTIAEAIAIKDGKFIAVGKNNTVLALAASGTTKRVDLQGRTVIPGLIDGHFRLMDRATAQYFGANVSLAHSVADLLDTVREAAARIPKGQVITSNSGWYPHMFTEGRDPTRSELDAAAPNHLVILRGEFIYLNSLALKQFNITKDTPQPDYGWIEKDSNGEPTGVLMGDAALLVKRAHLSFSHEQKMEALSWALQEKARAGLTGVREGGIAMSDLRCYHELYRRGELPIRVSAQLALSMMPPVKEILSNFERLQLNNPVGDHWFRMDRAAYIFADDDYNRMGMSTPIYNQRVPEDRITRFQHERESSTDKIEHIVTGMAKLGISGGILAGGDAMIDYILDILERANAVCSLKDRRWVMSQVVYPKPRHHQRLKDLGIVLTPMWHHYYYYPAVAAYHSQAIAQTMDPFRELLEAGVKMGLGSDVSQIPLNYFVAIYFLHTRNTWKWGAVNPEQAISREQALRLLTINNAFLSFEEKVKGSIEPGKLADLLVLSDDLMTVPVENIKRIRSLLTMVGGKVVHQDSVFKAIF